MALVAHAHSSSKIGRKQGIYKCCLVCQHWGRRGCPCTMHMTSWIPAVQCGLATRRIGQKVTGSILVVLADAKRGGPGYHNAHSWCAEHGPLTGMHKCLRFPRPRVEVCSFGRCMAVRVRRECTWSTASPTASIIHTLQVAIQTSRTRAAAN